MPLQSRKYHYFISIIRIAFGVFMMCFSNGANGQITTFSKVFSNYAQRAENGLNIYPYAGVYYLIGYNSCSAAIADDCMTITKLSSQGDILWIKEFEHYGSLQNQAVFVGEKIYLCGRTTHSEYQFLLYCLDLDGNIIWEKNYGQSDHPEWSPGIILLSDSTLLLFGSRDRQLTQPNEWLPVLMKVSLNGDSLTEFSFNAQYEATSALNTIEYGVHKLASAYVYCPDGCIVSLKAGISAMDTQGQLKWSLDFPYSYFPYNCLVSHFGKGELAVKWYVDSNIPNYDLTPPAIFFVDTMGMVMDTLIFQNQTLKEILYMQPGHNESLVGCGFEYIDYFQQSNPIQAGWMFQLNESQQITWEKTYIDTSFQGDSYGLFHMVPTPDGGYIATGTINNNKTGVLESHNWVLKLDASGCLQPGCGGLNYLTNTSEAAFLHDLKLKIGPNPATDLLTIEFPEGFDFQGCSVDLIAFSGIPVLHKSVETTPTVLQLKGASPGMYFLLLKRKNEILHLNKVLVHQ